ncbi:MAG: acyltransferase family protein, partial [bacterium]
MRRPEIDGLRGIAILAVVLSHIDKDLLSNGHLGVDIFYVISGFVITHSLVGRSQESASEFFIGFYNRRIKRLFPALFFCVAITMLFSLIVIPPNSQLFEVYIRTAISSLFGLSNFVLLEEATDYLGASAALNPFTHTWSLGVEEQFYLIFPVVVWFSVIRNNPAKEYRSFLIVSGIAFTLSLLTYIWLSTKSPIHAFYMMPARLWELSAGALTYTLQIKFTSWRPADSNLVKISAILSFILIVLILASSNLETHQSLSTVGVTLLTVILITSARSNSITLN